MNARVLAATNADLNKAMKSGRFREDLYYRLRVVNIELPPLRERGADILVLARILRERYAAENKRKIVGFSRQATMALEIYSWPGNIRELENRIRRAVIMANGPMLTPADMELASPHLQFAGRRLREAREALEKDIIQQALAKYKGNIAKTAAELGISRPTLYERMQKLELEREGSEKHRV